MLKGQSKSKTHNMKIKGLKSEPRNHIKNRNNYKL